MRLRHRLVMTAAGVVAGLLLSGCGASTLDEGVRDGFRHTAASYVESSSNGTRKYVGVFENTAGPADSATFVVRFLDRGEVVWRGRGRARDIAAAETVQVEITGTGPVPTGEYDVEFDVHAFRTGG